jgi:hypothetical protein
MGEYFADGLMVHRRDPVTMEDTYVCECSDFIAGAAEQIARALNRLPKAEELLVQAAQTLRGGVIEPPAELATEIEEWMING